MSPLSSPSSREEERGREREREKEGLSLLSYWGALQREHAGYTSVQDRANLHQYSSFAVKHKRTTRQVPVVIDCTHCVP